MNQQPKTVKENNKTTAANELEDDGKDLPIVNLDEPEIIGSDEMLEDEKVLELYEEILDNFREDREEIKNLSNHFSEMVINSGDATTSSKEALVNLMKLKSDNTDKMSKIADLMTRVKLKEKNTFVPYLKAHNAPNTINITPENKRRLLESIQKKENTNE